jgi:autotransporter family porin
MSRDPYRRTPWAWIIAAVVVAAGISAALALRALVEHRTAPPPPGGYFGLQPVGSYARLPGDAAAAAEVQYSTWEVRPANARYNHVMPVHLALQRVKDSTRAYDPRWNRYILARITGHFTGTTDEIFQWAAAKWGLPDDLIRTVAYMESGWRQSNYGDYVFDRARCPAGYRALPCPVTFGIVGTKSTTWPGVFPWNRDSTAAAVDVLGGWLRGCYEGWVWWLRDHGNRSHGVYHAGDIWGCVGAWYSGNWRDGTVAALGSGEYYIHRAQYWEQHRPWLHPAFKLSAIQVTITESRKQLLSAHPPSGVVRARKVRMDDLRPGAVICVTMTAGHRQRRDGVSVMRNRRRVQALWACASGRAGRGQQPQRLLA